MNPREDPAALLAQAFADHASRWAAELGAPAPARQMLARAAQAVSAATSAGHVCLDLADLADAATPVAAWRAGLLESRVAGTPGEADARPLIIDAENRLYLYRYYQHERQLARNLAQRARRPAALAAGALQSLAASLDQLFPHDPARAANQPDWQKIAAAAAVTGHLAIVSGGPGTGKTHTVAAVLGALLALDAGLTIALAAPTGKAAARMLEALAVGARRLPAALAAKLPTVAYTVHRLLGVTQSAGRFRHDAQHPLPYDVVVVDEASMLDLALAARLADAVRPDARLVLLGDKDQLAAVQAGAVFAELCADIHWPAARWAELAALAGTTAPAPPARPAAPGGTPLAGKVVFLTESRRFAAHSGIARLAAALCAGQGEAALAVLDTADPAELHWLPDSRAMPARDMAAQLAGLLTGQYAAYAQAVRSHAGDVTALFRAFEAFRVLCAVYTGPQGVDAINALLERHMRAAIAHPADPGAPSAWYPGRPVLILNNDYGLGLFNGDIGLCLPAGADGLSVRFARRDGSYAAYAPARLPSHASAWAMSVHKAQGSEFDDACVVLPDPASNALTRELLYTAVTRARKKLTLFGAPAAVAAACAQPTRRASGLRARLAEAWDDPAATAI